MFAKILQLTASAAVVMLIAACSSPGPRYAATDRHGAQAPTDLNQARRHVVQVAADLIGTPYRYGGNSRQGFDCSGLVQYAHSAAGVRVPRTTATQWQASRTPSRRHLLPGDLVFFSIGWRKNRHVGIYEGDGVFIHAPSSGKRVSRASLDNPYWRERLIGTRTFL